MKKYGVPKSLNPPKPPLKMTYTTEELRRMTPQERLISALNGHKTPEEMKVDFDKRPSIVKCSVSGIISFNGVGSTPFGGAWEYLFEDEVRELGIPPIYTRNHGLVKGEED